jgi:hypothetical protein
MEILTIATVILTIAMALVTLYRSIEALNQYGERLYRYEPISAWTVVPISVTHLLLLLAVNNLSHDPNNTYASIFLIFLTTICVCIRISVKSSSKIALMSIPILHGTAIVGILVVFLVCAGYAMEQSWQNDNS